MTDFSDIKNPRVAQLLKSYENRLLTDHSKLNNNYFASTNRTYNPSDFTHISIGESINQKRKKISIQYLQTSAKNKWLKKKGKGYLIDFDLKERKELKNFFNMLDKKKKGYIGLDQLEDMLLSLGLASNIEEVKEMMATVDEDHSGKIEFEQFLQMIQDDNTKYNGLVHFFKELIIGRRRQNQITNSKQDARLRKKLHYKTIMEQNNDNNGENLIKQQLAICPSRMPFQMIVNQVRRSHILSSLNIGRLKSTGSKSCMRIRKGQQVVGALQKMQERRLIRGFQTNSNFFQNSQ